MIRTGDFVSVINHDLLLKVIRVYEHGEESEHYFDGISEADEHYVHLPAKIVDYHLYPKAPKPVDNTEYFKMIGVLNTKKRAKNDR